MESGEFSYFRKQAQFIDESCRYLENRLAYPSGMFCSNGSSDAENVLEKVMCENNLLLQTNKEEKDIAEHNLQQMDNFMEEMDKTLVHIEQGVTNIEDKLQHYGYIPLANMSNGNDVSSCEEQIEELSMSTSLPKHLQESSGVVNGSSPVQ